MKFNDIKIGKTYWFIDFYNFNFYYDNIILKRIFVQTKNKYDHTINCCIANKNDKPLTKEEAQQNNQIRWEYCLKPYQIHSGENPSRKDLIINIIYQDGSELFEIFINMIDIIADFFIKFGILIFNLICFGFNNLTFNKFGKKIK